jgi:hypothetical protein
MDRHFKARFGALLGSTLSLPADGSAYRKDLAIGWVLQAPLAVSKL